MTDAVAIKPSKSKHFAECTGHEPIGMRGALDMKPSVRACTRVDPKSRTLGIEPAQWRIVVDTNSSVLGGILDTNTSRYQDGVTTRIQSAQ